MTIHWRFEYFDIFETIKHFRNSFHALVTVGKTDGLLALQKGLTPALCHQFFMNGVRLGTYQIITDTGITKRENGSVIWGRNVIVGAFAGCLGAAAGSPFYMVHL